MDHYPSLSGNTEIYSKAAQTSFDVTPERASFDTGL